MSDGHGVAPIPTATLFEYVREQIEAAASELWLGEPVRLDDHVPSVTNYVHRITVGGHPLYAKYTVLGAPLVSVLRGAHGAWDKVLAAQRDYVRRPDSLLARQAQQLYTFGEQRLLPVSRFAGFRDGVLFTDAITAGTALDEMLLAEPHQAARLLRSAWAPLTRVHAAPVHGWPMIAEQSIAATFNRTFHANGQRVGLPLRRGIDPDVVAGLRFVVRRLRTLHIDPPATGLVFGQAEPVHVLLTDDEPVYLAPGAHVSSPLTDLAKLVSRLLLVVICRAVATDARRQIVAGLTALIREERSRTKLAESSAWMSDLITLIAQDAAYVVSTYLSAPPRFPLPRTARAVVERAAVVVWVIEHLVTWLAQQVDPVELWARLTAEVVGS